MVHFGTSESGHYYDYICNPKNDIWYEFNDKNIKPVSLKEVLAESYGSTDIYDDSKNDNNTSAYILFYTQKSFWEIHQKNYENLNKFNFESEIAFPPYNKFSNINNKLLEIINFDMFKYWSIKLISENNYQNFIFLFVKVNLSKEINNLEKILNTLMNIEQENNNNNNSNNNDEEEKEIENLKLIKIKNKNNNNNNKITILFKFLLRYLFNIIYRLKDKKNFNNFINLFKVFINYDTQYAIYFIEEFSLIDTINEYLIFCPSKTLTSFTVDLIIYALFKIENDNDNNNKIFIFKFLNSILNAIDALVLGYDCQILFELVLKMILLEKNLINHLIKINFGDFIKFFYGKSRNNFGENIEEDDNNSIIDIKEIKKNVIKSEHQLLTENLIRREVSIVLSSLTEEHNDKKIMDRIKNWNYNNNKYLYKIFKLMYNNNNN